MKCSVCDKQIPAHDTYSNFCALCRECKKADDEWFFKSFEPNKEEKLRLLCGEILACLRVLLLRGNLTTDDDEKFEAKLNEWNERMKQ